MKRSMMESGVNAIEEGMPLNKTKNKNTNNYVLGKKLTNEQNHPIRTRTRRT